eukprot:8437679-Pyramimonas_sp.AAC.1
MGNCAKKKKSCCWSDLNGSTLKPCPAGSANCRADVGPLPASKNAATAADKRDSTRSQRFCERNASLSR